MKKIREVMHHIDQGICYVTNEIPREVAESMEIHELDAVPILKEKDNMTRANVITFINWPRLFVLAREFPKIPINTCPSEFHYQQFDFIQEGNTIFDAGLKLKGKYALICLNGNDITGIINTYDLSEYIIKEDHIAREKVFDLERRLKKMLFNGNKDDYIYQMNWNELQAEFGKQRGSIKSFYIENQRLIGRLKNARNDLMHPIKKRLSDAINDVDEIYRILDGKIP